MPNTAVNLLPLENKHEHITLAHSGVCYRTLRREGGKKKRKQEEKRRKKILLFSKIIPDPCPVSLMLYSFLPPSLLHNWSEENPIIKEMFTTSYYSGVVILLFMKGFRLKEIAMFFHAAEANNCLVQQLVIYKYTSIYLCVSVYIHTYFNEEFPDWFLAVAGSRHRKTEVVAQESHALQLSVTQWHRQPCV